MEQLFRTLMAADARIEQIICIAGAITADDTLPDSLAEFLRDDISDIEKCLGTLPDSVKERLENARQNYQPAWAFRDWALQAGKLGFLVHVATPVMSPSAYGPTYSWGYCYTGWMYGDTFDEAMAKALEWATARHKADEAKGRSVK